MLGKALNSLCFVILLCSVEVVWSSAHGTVVRSEEHSEGWQADNKDHMRACYIIKLVCIYSELPQFPRVVVFRMWLFLWAQSCPTLCGPMDCSPPGSSVPGFSRQEYWSGLPFPSPMWKVKVKVKSLNRVRLLATPWTAAHQGPPSMGFARLYH